MTRTGFGLVTAIIITIFTICEGQLFRKFVLVLDEKVANCAEPANDAKALDLSNYQILIETDTESYFNGSFKFIRDFENPKPVRIYAERFERGKWIVMYLDQKRSDFCTCLLNPTEVW